MERYSLTASQRFWLPFTWLFWKLTIVDNKKSWHEMKKGMEAHTCNFVKPHWVKWYLFLMCDHEGCYTCDDVDSMTLTENQKNIVCNAKNEKELADTKLKDDFMINERGYKKINGRYVK